MGVTGLWTILAPVKEHKALGSLQGETLAVDLSIWVCETKCVKQMQGIVTKPYLRNLFFRVSHLTQLGVKLVFVIDGKAPELKWQEMSRRQQALGRGHKSRAGKGGRSNFNRTLKECCELLDILGIPYIQSRGEAEAMCAALNSCGLVDACITDDGDAFLYGAKKVYRNFTMNSKDPHVESYSMTSIETNLGLNREKLVGMALLLGCDYLPGGVHGVGLERVIKLMSSLPNVNILKRFETWATISPNECVDKVEMFIRQKALAMSGFPQKQVIDEFLNSRETTPSRPFIWRRPLIQKAQSFAEVKLEWPTDYTLEKVLPLVTLWDLIEISLGNDEDSHLQPHRIVRTRVQHGVPVYEVEWHKQILDTSYSKDYYVTIEEQRLFSRCFPSTVQQFTNEVAEAKQNKKKGLRKKRTKLVKDLSIDELASQVSAIDLDLQSKPAADGKDKQILNSNFIDDKEEIRLFDIDCTAMMKECDKIKLKRKEKNHAINCTEVKSKEVICVQPVTSNNVQPNVSNIQPFISNNVQSIVPNVQPFISNMQSNIVRPFIPTIVQPITSECVLPIVSDIEQKMVQPVLLTSTSIKSLRKNSEVEQHRIAVELKENGDVELKENSDVENQTVLVDSDEEESDEDVILSLTQRLQLKLGGNKHPAYTDLNAFSWSSSTSACQASVKEALRQGGRRNSKHRTKGLKHPVQNCVVASFENSGNGIRMVGKAKGTVNVDNPEKRILDMPSVSRVKSDHIVLKQPAAAVDQTEFCSEEYLIPSKHSNCFKQSITSGDLDNFFDETEFHQKENDSFKEHNDFLHRSELHQKENISCGSFNSFVDRVEFCEAENIISSGGFNCLSLKGKSHSVEQKHNLSLVENKTSYTACTPDSSSNDFNHLLGMITSFPTPQVDYSVNKQVHRPSETNNLMVCKPLMSSNSFSRTLDEHYLQNDKKLAKNISIDIGNFYMQTSLLKDSILQASPCLTARDDSLEDCSNNKTPQCTQHYQKQTAYFNSPLLFDSPERSFRELNHLNPLCESNHCDQPVPSTHCQNYEQQIVNEKQTTECGHSEVHNVSMNFENKRIKTYEIAAGMSCTGDGQDCEIKEDNTSKSWICHEETDDKAHDTVMGRSYIGKRQETEIVRFSIGDNDETEDKEQIVKDRSHIVNGEMEDTASMFYSTADDSLIHSPLPLSLADRLGHRLTKNALQALQSMSKQ